MQPDEYSAAFKNNIIGSTVGINFESAFLHKEGQPGKTPPRGGGGTSSSTAPPLAAVAATPTTNRELRPPGGASGNLSAKLPLIGGALLTSAPRL